MTKNTSSTERVRLDKWLWVARFFKTRGLSADEIGKGRVEVNGQAAKASRELHPGDTIELRQGPVTRTLIVRALSLQRGPAAVAQALYEETPESIALRVTGPWRNSIVSPGRSLISPGGTLGLARSMLISFRRLAA